MRWKNWLIVAAILLLPSSAESFGQSFASSSRTARILRNRDVVLMVKSGMQSDQIIAKIQTSPCNFDIFPPVLDDLRRRGVPESVLRIMAVVPSGPANFEVFSSELESPAQKAKVKMPQGLGILVETLYPVSSADFKAGSMIALSVVSPVYIDGVLTIGRGTIARARIVRAKKARSWGRGGALKWEMEYIVAIDGTRIPVQLSAASEGENRGGELAAGVAVTSALVFPYTAPAALVWGFKKGEDAILRGSQQFAAIISGDTEVVGLVPDKERVFYHYAESLKAKMNTASTATSFPRLGIRN